MVDTAKIAKIEERLVEYYKAEKAVTTGQEYSIGNRSLKRADLSEINDMIIKLNSQLSAARRGGKIRMQRVVPRDGV